METITRNVNEIESADRLAIEHVIGRPLSESQQIVIQVLSPAPTAPFKTNHIQDESESGGLPEWCNVYEGLSDDEIADIERSIFRSRESRTFD